MGKMIGKNKALETIKGRIFKANKSRWWVAESESLDVFTQGESHKDAMFMLKDAIELLATEYKLNLSVRIVPGEGDAVYIGTDDTKAMLTFLAHRQRQKNRRLLNGMNIKDIRENYMGKIGRKNEVEVFQGKLTAEESSAVARRLTGRSPQKRSPSHVVIGKTSVPIEAVMKYAKRLVRDETIMIRVDKKRFKQIKSCAKKIGISVEQYLLVAENYFASDILSKPLEVFQGKLTAEESNALAKQLTGRYAKKYSAMADDAFGDRVKAARWMVKPCRALGNKKPLSLLNNKVGRGRVKDVLGQIKYGLYS